MLRHTSTNTIRTTGTGSTSTGTWYQRKRTKYEDVRDVPPLVLSTGTVDSIRPVPVMLVVL
jgi:hypothetical protein